MSKFTTRIQLKGEPERGDYERLHAAMKNSGFTQTIIGNDGVEYRLPHAEYNYEADVEVSEVRDLAQKTAESVWEGVYILVTQSAGRSWILGKIRDGA